MTSTEVLVAGAGVGGCATALELARRGTHVVLVGSAGAAQRGLSGEWLHPAGVTALRQLGVQLDPASFTENHGFMLHPGPGHSPIALPYTHGTALSMSHHTLVDRLRQAVSQHSGITLLLGERLIQATPSGSAVTTVETFQPGLLVGADGRASLVRRALRPEEPAAAMLSATAGFELTGAQLPTEGYGHIFLGGPGPALAYRIGPDTIRLSLDGTPHKMSPPEMLRYLRHGYAPALPDHLRAAFLAATAHQPRPRWATNRFRRRRFYGHSDVALVGDAVGFGHPLAAHGMTTAILDAQSLAHHRNVTTYARERRARSWTSERLGIALHRAVTDAGSAVMREALFQLWRHNRTERDRMMRLLAVQEDSRNQFGLTVAHIAAAALSLGPSSRRPPRTAAITQQGRATLYLANWLLWLCRSNPATPWLAGKTAQEHA